eukprot:TRINITY_DN997_c0_g1_i1.p2 TRINITY_DN997_c0_g1~~TRINITY_DN997_c0_g1_i1.p2  ORF type:complete len:282 (-),score=63.09 TRINITY_DN997_c0_g1_i1:37-882(-)
MCIRDRYLGIKKVKDSEAYQKSEEQKDINFLAKIRKMIETGSEVESKASSDSDKNSDDSEDENEKIEKKVKNGSENEQNFLLVKEPDTQNQGEEGQNKPKKIFGPSLMPFIAPQGGLISKDEALEINKALSETQKPQESSQKAVFGSGNDLESFLESTFAKVPEKKVGDTMKHNKWHDMLKKTEDTKQSESSQYSKAEEDLRRKQIEEWNQRFRGQSLMEIHKQKMADKKKKGGSDRRRFDREQDLSVGRIDSKKLYEVLKNPGEQLSSKFSEGTLKKSFI